MMSNDDDVVHEARTSFPKLSVLIGRLPAWCRMTGHILVSADHPVYVIQRKTD
jgi:hypothetical protein